MEREELVRVLTLYGDGTDTEAVARRIADAICIKRAEEGDGGAGGIPTRTRELAPPLLLLLPFPSLPAFPPDNLLSKVSPRNIWEIKSSDWCRMLQVSLPSLSLR